MMRSLRHVLGIGLGSGLWTSAAQETLWYAMYAFALWIVVAIVVMIHRNSLVRQQP